MICIVDDDDSVRESLRDLLESLGYAVSTFESAERFLESGRLAETSCLISDVQMPGLSGLDLQSRLIAEGHCMSVIFVTAFPEERYRLRAKSAGAVGFLSKPFDEGALIGCLETAIQRHAEITGSDHYRRKPARASFAGGTVRDHCHICAFFNGADEEHNVLRSFIKDGLDVGEKAFHIVDPDLRDDHLRRLAQSDMNVEQAIATGQLEVRSWQEAYLRGDRFEQDAMLALVDKVLQSNAAAGYSHTRIVAHMEWALLDKPGVDDLIEYETRVNYVLAKYHDPVICAYDLSKFSASVAIDVMRTHPMVIIGGVLKENPFFIPPDQFFSSYGSEGWLTRVHSAELISSRRGPPTSAGRGGSSRSYALARFGRRSGPRRSGKVSKTVNSRKPTPVGVLKLRTPGSDCAILPG